MSIGGRSPGGVVTIVVTNKGSGYTSPPSVTVSGGGGASAVAYAHMAGSQVDYISVYAPGSGYTSNPTVSISGGGGTGAAAKAYAYTGQLQPMSFFKGRYNDLYGVDGMGRGIQWDGTAASVSPIGLLAPFSAPTVTASTTGFSGRVTAVQMVNCGAGYNNVPAVTFNGTATTDAKGKAVLSNGRITGVVVTEPGAGYTDTPTVSFSGGIGSGVDLQVGVLGAVDSIDVVESGSGYSTEPGFAPSVVFSSGHGLTDANAVVSVTQDGRIDSAYVIAAGTGATAPGAVASVVAASGSGAVLNVRMVYGVNAVTVASSGSGFYTPPVITFRPDSSDPFGAGASATAAINTTGNLTGATVTAGGQYYAPPTAVILDTSAKATATVSQPLIGKYQCCVRYVSGDLSSPEGQVASSISDLFEIDVGDSAQSLTWSVTHTALDARVTAMELWRTTSDQSVLLFRVATIPRGGTGWSSYVDSLNDDDLADPNRDGYGLMPITLPSGQINARRFGVPPGEFAVACMFQDRAWYASDTTGQRPNSLLFSEIDEPESVPQENELVVQENTGVADKILALIPFASTLLVVQGSHMYALSYVAQPVIDASIRLVSYRGILNNRCWDVIGGVAYIVDSSGMYAFDGTQEQPISVAVDNFWRDKVIDFSKSNQFHVRADFATKTVRFFYCQSGDTETVRALCYGLATQAWWEEVFPTAITATCPVVIGGRYEPLSGTADGKWVKNAGTSDSGTAIPYEFRTGPMSLVTENSSRSVSVLYKPTSSTATLGVRLHFNNSSTPRPNAVASSRGDGFVTVTGSTEATLDMSLSRSALGNAVGMAKAYFSGRADDRSAGADRHVAVAAAGTQPTTDGVVLYGIGVEGVQ